MTARDQTLRPDAVVPDGTRAFRSLLFPPGGESLQQDRTTAPSAFIDLNLDQIIDAIVAKRDETVLRPVFYTPYRDEAIVRYRQEIFRDTMIPSVVAAATSFCSAMHRMRIDLGYADQIKSLQHRRMVLLRARTRYCAAISEFLRALDVQPLDSSGLRALRSFLAGYTASAAFVGLLSESRQVDQSLSAITYGMLFRGDKVIVRRYASESDYATMVLERFERFRGMDDAPEDRPPLQEHALNHIEEAILEFVALLFPEPFHALQAHLERFTTFIDDTVARADRELGFFIAYLTYIAPLKEQGLPFCFPEVSAASKETAVVQGFDLALAHKLHARKSAVVCNDFMLAGHERILVVSGPNQGGKTTFARMFGQLHYLAGLGCPIPGKEARLFLPDRVFTHFERAEQIANLRSKLEDELVRLKATCDAMTSNSVVILNEVFNSTMLEDQQLLSIRILESILATGALGICVTFIDALSTLDDRVVSMVSTVRPDDPARRTFRIRRKPADGLAYALSLAEKHGLTYEHLRARIRP